MMVYRHLTFMGSPFILNMTFNVYIPAEPSGMSGYGFLANLHG